MALDLSRASDVAERHEKGVWVPVKDEAGKQDTYMDGNGQAQPSGILMAGAYSRRYRRKKEEQDRRKLDQRTFTEGKFSNDGMELVVACVLDWCGIEADGKPLDCTTHNARAVFEAYPWVYRACDEAVNEPANFLPQDLPKR